jgi:hypothetical protein
MFGLFTKNLYTMERATKTKKGLDYLDLEQKNRLKKEQLGELLGGNDLDKEKKKGRSLFGLFSICEGKLPQ